MRVTWKTKYGIRSVRVEPPPTVEDALFAAEGLTRNVEQQITIAAGLLEVSIEEARAEAKRVLSERKAHSTTQVHRRGSMPPVLVMRKAVRRFGNPR